MNKTPESAVLLERAGNLKAYFDRHMARPSVKETIPPPFPGRTS
jgi:hypothetical protein